MLVCKWFVYHTSLMELHRFDQRVSMPSWRGIWTLKFPQLPSVQWLSLPSPPLLSPPTLQTVTFHMQYTVINTAIAVTFTAISSVTMSIATTVTNAMPSHQSSCCVCCYLNTLHYLLHSCQLMQQFMLHSSLCHCLKSCLHSHPNYFTESFLLPFI